MKLDILNTSRGRKINQALSEYLRIIYFLNAKHTYFSSSWNFYLICWRHIHSGELIYRKNIDTQRKLNYIGNPRLKPWLQRQVRSSGVQTQETWRC